MDNNILKFIYKYPNEITKTFIKYKIPLVNSKGNLKSELEIVDDLAKIWDRLF